MRAHAPGDRHPHPVAQPHSNPVPTRPPPATATPLPTPTLFERASGWPGSGWALGVAIALLAIAAVVQAMRLRRQVIGG